MDYLADTVAIIRHLDRHPALGRKARQILVAADQGQHRIHLSAISLMETLYIAEAKRIPISFADVVQRITSSSNYLIHPVDVSILLVAAQIDDIREMHDRVIAATAKHLNVPILTSDEILSRSRHITTIWA
jgi:predicted nucleic acid-binding protein